MGTQALTTAEQYLAAHYEWEPELAHGEIASRPLPTRSHGRTQQRLAVLLDRLGYCCTEVRMKLADELFRIPDVAVFEGNGPEQEIPELPPLLLVEISSPDDRHNDLLKKLDEYRAWGVQHIWLVEPDLKQAHVYDNGSLTLVAKLELPQFNFTVIVSELFD